MTEHPKRNVLNGKNNLMQRKLANDANEDLLQDFKLNSTLLNEVIYATAIGISSEDIKHTHTHAHTHTK